jgi:hypothetical protein
VPSLFEAMSLTVWDAQKLGTAVACSAIAPFPCQVGKTARLFDPHDPGAIANTLSELWGNEQLRKELIQAAFERTAGLTARNYAEAMIGIYQSVIGGQETESSIQARQNLVSSICTDPL